MSINILQLFILLFTVTLSSNLCGWAIMILIAKKTGSFSAEVSDAKDE